MTVCSDMLELILGPINLVNPPRSISNFVVNDNDDTNDTSNQSDVAIACTAMSCSIEDRKDIKDNKDIEVKNDIKDKKDIKGTKETKNIEGTKDNNDTNSVSTATKLEETDKGMLSTYS